MSINKPKFKPIKFRKKTKPVVDTPMPEPIEALGIAVQTHQLNLDHLSTLGVPMRVALDLYDSFGKLARAMDACLSTSRFAEWIRNHAEVEIKRLEDKENATIIEAPKVVN
jgi:hypothetical protein